MNNIRLHLLSVYSIDKDVHKWYVDFLYKLLLERERHQSISHKEMPTFNNHTKFINSKPYKEWYILQQNVAPWSNVGALYLTNKNEVGLFLLKEFQDRGYGSKALVRFLRVHKERPLYANINPNNAKSLAFFRKHGFEPFTVTMDVTMEGEYIVQKTYMLSP